MLLYGFICTELAIIHCILMALTEFKYMKSLEFDKDLKGTCEESCMDIM